MLALPPGQPPTDAGLPQPGADARVAHAVHVAPAAGRAVVPAPRDDRVRAGGPQRRVLPRLPGLASGSVDLVPGHRPARRGAARRERRGVRGAARCCTRSRASSSAPRPHGEPCCSPRLFPTAFFLYAPYTESLFLLASIAAFWFARRDRWVWAAVAGARGGGDPQRRHPVDPRAVGRGDRAVAARWPAAPAAARRGRGRRARAAAVSRVVAVAPRRHFWAPLDAQRAWRPGGAHQPSRSSSERSSCAWRYQTWWLLDVTVVALAVAGHRARRAPHPPDRTRSTRRRASLLPLLLPFDEPTPAVDAAVRGGGVPGVVGLGPRGGATPAARDRRPRRVRGRLRPARATCSSTGSPSSERADRPRRARETV